MKLTMTIDEHVICSKIADRALQRGMIECLPLKRLDLLMDLEACHSNGCPLDFDALLSFKPGDFTHDVVGISININRATGQLENYFLPRCAKGGEVEPS